MSTSGKAAAAAQRRAKTPPSTRRRMSGEIAKAEMQLNKYVSCQNDDDLTHGPQTIQSAKWEWENQLAKNV